MKIAVKDIIGYAVLAENAEDDENYCKFCVAPEDREWIEEYSALRLLTRDWIFEDQDCCFTCGRRISQISLPEDPKS